jgi:hypothetical protein
VNIQIQAEQLYMTISAVCPILDGTFRVGINGVPDTAVWQPDPSATADQIAAGQAALTAFDWTCFSVYQANAVAAIQANSQALLANPGFTYNGSSFPADDATRTRYVEMVVMAQAGAVVYPVTVQTTALQGAQLADIGEVGAFAVACTARTQYVLEGEVSLVQQIMAATNVAGVDAVIDERA